MPSRGRPNNVLGTPRINLPGASPERQNVRLERPLDVISRRPRDGQIGSLGGVQETLEGDVLRTSWVIKIYKKCTVEPYSFLVNDTRLMIKITV